MEPNRREGSLARERSEWERAGERAISGIGPSPQPSPAPAGEGAGTMPLPTDGPMLG